MSPAEAGHYSFTPAQLPIAGFAIHLAVAHCPNFTTPNDRLQKTFRNSVDTMMAASLQ
jgi:hypothetical protein